MRFRRRGANVEGARHPPRTRSDAKFMFRTKTAQWGVYSAPRSKCRPLGHGQSAQTSFHTRTKTVHGRCERRMTAGADKFSRSERKPLSGAFIRLLGANAAYRPTNGWCERVSTFGAKATRRFVRPASTGSRRASVMAVVFTCNTYSVPYKGKPPKKRLSPKSLNTLIHQCITFYVFLIFQYLSLWKSVFSSN